MPLLTFPLHMVMLMGQTPLSTEEKMDYLLALDREVFLWINNKWANPYLDPLFSVITWLGNGWIIILLVVIFFAIKRPTYLRQHLPWLAAAMLLSGLCILFIKKMVYRPRPLSDFAPLIAAGKVQIHVVGTHLWLKSFPSGHAQTAFAAGTYLSLLLPRWTPLFLALATGVGLSRIYMGAHFPLDVIIGGLVGIIFAWGVWLLRKKVQRSSIPRS